MSEEKTTKSPKDSHYARLRRAYRDGKPVENKNGDGKAGDAKTGPNSWPKRERGPALAGKLTPADRVRLYGLHTVGAALANPARRFHRLMATRNAMMRLDIEESALPCKVEIVEPRALDTELGTEAVHQGIMLEADPLDGKRLADLGDCQVVLVLDQVTDPHNVGAILRSAAAFGAGALITTSRHSPQESGVLAKSASGALELVPYVQIVNLADGLQELARAGYRTVGLDSEGATKLEEAFAGSKIALVLGSEGKGLRQKTRETVDVLARLEVPGAIRSLNVSNAAAVALYAARRYLD